MPVPEYDLTMDAVDLKWLRSHAGTSRCFPAALRVGPESWPAWIGYRGCYSRWFRKPSYDIWFGADRPFSGHARLHLNAAYRDPSLLRGRLALSLFSDMGVPTPRAWHVWLRVNGHPLGLYSAIESLDSAWLERQGMTGGSIYYAVGTKGNFGLIDPDTERPKRYPAAGYEKCTPWDDDFSDLESLIYQITLPPPAEFETQIATVLDVETCLRWVIGIEFMSHTDGFVQNYALFRPPDGLWQVSPWDCDGTFGRIPDGRIYRADEMPVGTGNDNYLLARLLTTPRWRRRYLTLWPELLGQVLSTDHVLERMESLLAEIGPYARRDEKKRRTNDTFRREPARIRTYLAERTEFIRARLFRRRTTDRR